MRRPCGWLKDPVLDTGLASRTPPGCTSSITCICTVLRHRPRIATIAKSFKRARRVLRHRQYYLFAHIRLMTMPDTKRALLLRT